MFTWFLTNIFIRRATISDSAVTPNPNNGVFTIQFYLTSTANVDYANTGYKWTIAYINQNIRISRDHLTKTISLGAVSAGMYVLQLEVGVKKYIQKIMVY